LSYTWEFGDGNTIITTVNTISHTYTTAKNYTAKVTVTDNFGSSASDTVDLTVTTAPTGGGVPPGGPYYPYGGLALLPAAPETNDYTIDLAAGVETLQLKVGDTVTITFEGGSYYSTVDSITDRITFGGVLAGSYSQYDVIKKDLNRDGKTDLVAIVNNIVNGSAFVTFMAAEKYEVAAPAPSPIVNVSLGPVCGNGVCEAGEDSTSCPADCPAPPTGLLGLTGAFLTSPAGIAGIGGFVLGVAVIGSIAEWRKRHALAIQRAKHIEVIQKLKRKVKK
jgi:hypothetical protein